MLRVARITDRTGRYYLEDLATELAVAELAAGRPASSRGFPGRWLGSGAEELGLRGTADPASLSAVLSGNHPATGRQLRVRQTLISGYDLTFSAPKSVSVLFGLAGAEVSAAVLSAHGAAVDAAMDYVASHGLAVRRAGAGADERSGGCRGPVAVAFTHGVSRALDPHLHTHVVVANLAHGLDCRWTAVDGRGLYAHARAAGALYDAHLRGVLSDEMSLEWSRRSNGAYEVASVDPVVIGALSGRSAAIRAHLHERASSGPDYVPSRRARAVAWAATRDGKCANPTPAALRRLWARRAAGVCVDSLDLVAARDGAARTPTQGARGRERRGVGAKGDHRLDEHRFAAGFGGTAHAAPSRRDVVAAWASALGRGAGVGTVDRCVDLVAGWGDGIGVGEVRHPVGRVLAPSHLLRAIGPRPSSPGRLSIWQSAATAVERYRSSWRLEDPRRPLGVATSTQALSAMPSRRLADHLAAARAVADANRLLGRDVGREIPSPERALGRG
jgi:conjugative relaxase-like TrwC/TraI family protein